MGTKELGAGVNIIRVELPKYVFLNEYKWLLQDVKGLSDHIKFHKKWGSPNLLYRKNKVADILIRFKLGLLNRFVLGYDLSKT